MYVNKRVVCYKGLVYNTYWINVCYTSFIFKKYSDFLRQKVHGRSRWDLYIQKGHVKRSSYRSQAPETSRLARSGQIINLGGVRKNWTRVILVTSPLQHPYQSITHPSWITPIWITPPNSMQGWYYEFLKFKMYFSIITKFYNIEG